MAVFDQVRAGAKFSPSAKLVRFCENALASRAYVETIRPIVEGYQKAILEAGDYWMCDQWHREFVKAEIDPGKLRITEPERTYLLPQAAANRYHEACRQAAKKAGLHVLREGNCPLLEARHLLVRAEEALLAVFASEMEVPELAEPLPLGQREKALSCIYGLLTPHIGSVERVLRRLAA